MRRFFYRALFFLSILALLDGLLGLTLRHMFFANRSGAPGYVLNHLMDKPYDAYIMGASGAQRGYVPAVLQQELGISVFNTGEAGTNIFHNYAALQLILQKHKPKLIIWDLTNADYFYRPDASKTGMISPYYHHPAIYKMLLDIQPLNRFWLCSKSYPYNQKILSILSTYLHKSAAEVMGDNGYHPLFTVFNPREHDNPLSIYYEELTSTKQRSKEQQRQDLLIRKYFHAFIKLCRENDIKLIAFHCPKAPLNHEVASTPLLAPELKAQLTHYNIPLFSIMPSEYPAMFNPGYYYDFSHLNHAGATAYSRIIATKLKAVLN